MNNINSELVLKALANPVEVLSTSASGIEALVNDFPQSGLLRALLAGNGHDQNVKHAAAYINPATLYKLVNFPESLMAVDARHIAFIDDENITSTTTPIINNTVKQPQPVEYINHEVTNNEPVNETVINEPVVDEEDVLSSPAEETHFHPVEEEVEYVVQPQYNETEVVDTNVPEAVEVEERQKEQYEPPYTLDKTEFFHQDIEDEVYEEIVSIEDINLGQISSQITGNNDTQQPIADKQIPANDHFVIDHSFVQAQSHKALSSAVATIPRDRAAENQNLSRYNDEKMPYSFMWWLDKTRKQYAQTYQPYVYNSPVAPDLPRQKNNIDELQQQYVENIFNLNAIEELERSTAQRGVNFNADKKEDRIIKRFIQTEPQIKHPTDVKLNNENKAKKSSEDSDELITETLARIYTEQMLYPKAITAYKKLMLKYPEKSLYFAGQIEQLEKKSN
ncbi:MAG: hypothetical protein EOP47_00400 [Sphingobacteriaceae bacterium]|nr:MAG: hypothetical protein EOP47_00400 [Sphingobacteriaceae bacterium]